LSANSLADSTNKLRTIRASHQGLTCPQALVRHCGISKLAVCSIMLPYACFP
jgi:hypothetical protein